MNKINSRFLIRQITGAGVEPTIPGTSNHLDGTWLDTDIYDREIVINTTDDRIWYRSRANIIELSNTGDTLWEVDGDFDIKPKEDKTVNYDNLSNVAVGVTYSTIYFDKNYIYHTPTEPMVGNIEDDLTDARLGLAQKIYHEDSATPSFPAGWVLLGKEEYSTTNLNIIYAEWVLDNRVEYWIVREN